MAGAAADTDSGAAAAGAVADTGPGPAEANAAEPGARGTRIQLHFQESYQADALTTRLATAMRRAWML